MGKTLDLGPDTAARYVRYVGEALTRLLQQGNSVTIRGFGRFKVYTRKAHRRFICHPFRMPDGSFIDNPSVELVPERKRVKFIPHPSLKRMVNAEYLGSDPIRPDDYKRPSERDDPKLYKNGK